MSDKEIIRNYKYDITRLKNLLRDYRDHIITNRMNTFENIDPVKIIYEVDKAIKILRDGLK